MRTATILVLPLIWGIGINIIELFKEKTLIHLAQIIVYFLALETILQRSKEEINTNSCRNSKKHKQYHQQHRCTRWIK